MNQTELINELEALGIYTSSIRMRSGPYNHNQVEINGYYKPNFKDQNMTETLRTQAEAISAVRAKEFIIVSVAANGDFSVASSPAVHTSATDARAEAKRLARITTGKAFVILNLVGAEMVPVSTVSI